ncbi:peptidase M23, partial [Enterococcus faecium]
MKLIRRGSLGFLFFLVLAIVFSLTGAFGTEEEGSNTGSGGEYTGIYTEDLPSFPEIKGTGNVPDEIAQLAVGSAVKYHLLPSVIISQWAYESEWGHSASAKNDN